MIFRLLFLILFLIIAILFTVGYNFFPLINFKSKLYEGVIFINKLVMTDNLTNTKTTSNYDELTIDSNYKMILKYVYYGCIATSCLIAGGIILSYLRMKFISKILFILAQTFMTTFVGLIVFMYYSSSFIDSFIPSIKGMDIPEEYKNITTSYGSGGMLIIISSIMMIVNYILYSFIG
jgi:hypothetical protein